VTGQKLSRDSRQALFEFHATADNARSFSGKQNADCYLLFQNSNSYFYLLFQNVMQLTQSTHDYTQDKMKSTSTTSESVLHVTKHVIYFMKNNLMYLVCMT